jgi:hypothetical protein
MEAVDLGADWYFGHPVIAGDDENRIGKFFCFTEFAEEIPD